MEIQFDRAVVVVPLGVLSSVAAVPRIGPPTECRPQHGPALVGTPPNTTSINSPPAPPGPIRDLPVGLDQSIQYPIESEGVGLLLGSTGVRRAPRRQPHRTSISDYSPLLTDVMTT